MVEMANRRMIYQDFFEDDYFGTKEYGMRLLWIGLIAAAADDQGRVLDNTSLIRAKVFMYDDTPNDDVDNWLTELNADGKIIRYTADSKPLIQITKWWEYQTPSWASESKYPAPPNWTDRIKCHVTGGGIKNVNWDKDGGLHKELHSQLPNQQDRPINDVKSDDDINDDDEGDIESAKSDFSEFQKVWEQETGRLIAGFTQFYRMCEDFVKVGVTPELYRTAIQEQSNSSYSVSNPTSVKNWAIGLLKKKDTGNKTQDATDLILQMVEEVWND
jgi:hypothetical protein